MSIGRGRKREIKALIHLWLKGQIAPDKVHYMRGLLAFARDIEPDFEINMRKKYGNLAINQILRHPSLDVKFDENFKDFNR